jgi:hypothetical protein
MTKNFDQICKGILGEMITPPAQPQKPGQTAPAAPAPQAGAPAAVQQNQQQNQQNAQQQAPQMKDEDLLKLLAQKIQDPKFLPQLQALMNPQQPNAANKPA